MRLSGSVSPLRPRLGPVATVRAAREDVAGRGGAAAAKPTRTRAAATHETDPADNIVPLHRTAPLTEAGFLTQHLFHARFGDRPEESLVHATAAYLRIDDLRFDTAPHSRMVA